MHRSAALFAGIALAFVGLSPWRWRIATASPDATPAFACASGLIEVVRDTRPRLVCLDTPAALAPGCAALAPRPGARLIDAGEAGCSMDSAPIAADRRLALGGRLDLNREPPEGLVALPGVGPRMAARIAAERPFMSLADLERVRGIGPKTRAALEPLLELAPP
jgi:competence protein ComEA